MSVNNFWKDEWTSQALTASSVVEGNDGKYYRCIKGHTSTVLLGPDEPGVGEQWSTYWTPTSNSTGATAWAETTAYTTIAEFTPDSDTIKIKEAFYRENATSYDYTMEVITLQEYMNFEDKIWQSYPDKLVFIEELAPKCIIYPHPRNTDYVIHYLREKAIIDFTGAGSNPDFPDRWMDALIWALAANMTSMYTIPLNERIYFDNKAKEAIALASRGEFDGQAIGQFVPAYPM